MLIHCVVLFIKYLFCFFLFLHKKIVDFALAKDFNEIVVYGISSLILAFLFVLFQYLVSKTIVLIYGDIDYYLKKEISKKIAFGEYDEVIQKEFGYYLQRHNSDIDEIRFLYFEKDIDFVINVIYFIGLFFAMIRIDLVVSLVKTFQYKF